MHLKTRFFLISIAIVFFTLSLLTTLFKKTLKEEVPNLSARDQVRESIANDDAVLNVEDRNIGSDTEVLQEFFGNEVPKTNFEKGMLKRIFGDKNPKTNAGNRVQKPNAGKGVPKINAGKGVPKINAGKGVPRPNLEKEVQRPNLEKGIPKTNLRKGVPKPNVEKGVPKINVGKGVPKTNVGKGVPKTNVGKEFAKPTSEKKIPDIILKHELSRLIPQNTSQNCSPQTNIMFLKPHKTGTSTVQNLLFRYAIKHQLLLAMPHPFEIIHFKQFNRNWLFPLKPGYEYNIFAHHSIFDYEEMRAVMPDNTTFITVLRDPVAQFESAYSFFQFEEFFGMNITTFALLNRSEPDVLELQNRRKNFRFGRNQQAFSFGIRPEQFDDEAAILKKIQELDGQLDLALITSSMDQSLILLKDELCWNDFWDIVSVQRNSRSTEKKVVLSQEVRNNIRRINRADQLIYDHFYKKFNDRIEKFGAERMKAELAQLEAAKEEVKSLCFVNGTGNEVVDMKMKMKKGAKSYEICANLLNFGRHFSTGIFERKRELYEVSDAEVAALRNSLPGIVKLKFDPAYRFLLEDLGYADSE